MSGSEKIGKFSGKIEETSTSRRKYDAHSSLSKEALGEMEPKVVSFFIINSGYMYIVV